MNKRLFFASVCLPACLSIRRPILPSSLGDLILPSCFLSLQRRCLEGTEDDGGGGVDDDDGDVVDTMYVMMNHHG